MKIFSIVICRKDPSPTKVLAEEYDLSSFNFFQRIRFKWLRCFNLMFVVPKSFWPSFQLLWQNELLQESGSQLSKTVSIFILRIFK
jgi:hypothetical protein